MSMTFYNYKAFFKHNALLIFLEKKQNARNNFSKTGRYLLFSYSAMMAFDRSTRLDRFFIAI